MGNEIFMPTLRGITPNTIVPINQDPFLACLISSR
jgi:hypothetical protein